MNEHAINEDAARAKIREVLARPDYLLDSTQYNDDVLRWWLWLIEMLLTPFRWLFELTEGLPEFLRWVIVVVLSLLLIAFITHIIYTMFSALRGTSPRDAGAFAANLLSAGPDATTWERLAGEAEQRGEWIEAVRLLMRASVARFELREKRTFRRGTTNREHLRRYRSTEFHEPLEVLVRAIEWKWYGEEPCERADFETCRRAYGQLVELIH